MFIEKCKRRVEGEEGEEGGRGGKKRGARRKRRKRRKRRLWGKGKYVSRNTERVECTSTTVRSVTIPSQ